MKFFKPEDFDSYYHAHPEANATGVMAQIANEKLEKEAKIIYSVGVDADGRPTCMTINKCDNSKYQMLAICIEPTEKCKHEPEKVKVVMTGSGLFPKLQGFECSCGQKLKVSMYSEVKE